MKPTFILDNGASTIKLGFATDQEPQIIPNCKMKVKSERQRQYIGDQIEECKDRSGMYYVLAHQRGFIMNWDVEREIWDYSLNKHKNLNPKETDLIITEPHFNFKAIQNNTDEVLFEEYGFDSVFRTDAGYLSSFASKSLACMVVDSGFSFTHIAPYLFKDNSGLTKLRRAVRRIDVGGKALTNHLKEIVSYRQMNVMDETYVMNQCKEDVCYVALDFEADLRRCQQYKHNKIARDYVLPDFTNIKRGFVRKPDFKASQIQTDSSEPQFIRLANERFQVPEILFNPSDIGIGQVGIVEAIVDSIESVPEEIRHLLYANIILTGGNANIVGFRERVLQGLRSYCPSEYQVNVILPDNPITHPWHGGKVLAVEHHDIFKELAITKKQYEESGKQK